MMRTEAGTTCCITKVIAFPHLRQRFATRERLAASDDVRRPHTRSHPSRRGIAALPVLFADLMSRLATVEVRWG